MRIARKCDESSATHPFRRVPSLPPIVRQKTRARRGVIAQRAGIAQLSSSLENTDWHFDSESIMLEFLSELMNLKLETQRLKSPVDKWLPPRAVLPSGSLIPPWPLGYHMLRKLDQDCGSKQNGWLGRTRRGGYLAGEHAIGQEAMTAMGGGELAADFVSGPVGYRFRRGAARSHPLARAAGDRKS